MVPAAPAAIAETAVQTGDTAVESPAVEGIAVKSATVESAPAVETSSATVRCLGEVRLAQQCGAQQPSGNACCTPPFLWPRSIG
jgi:hypothetical protein